MMKAESTIRADPNVWWGVSVENQVTADERIPLLLRTPAAVRFVSAEPLLGAIDLRAYMAETVPFDPYYEHQLDWVIVGGESGPHARPMHPDWVRSIRDQCRAAQVPFFFKQWGEWIPEADADDARKNMRGVPCEILPGAVVRRVGKKAAGRLLDGRTWEEYPR